MSTKKYAFLRVAIMLANLMYHAIGLYQHNKVAFRKKSTIEME